MKAITILQPWAALIACNAKKIETRSWYTAYRGEIAIHAGKSEKYLSFALNEPFLSALEPFRKKREIPYSKQEEYFDFEFGKVIAIAELVDCAQFSHSLIPRRNTILLNGKEITDNEIAFGDCTPPRYAWVLDNIRMIEPVPAKGRLGLWNWEGDTK